MRQSSGGWRWSATVGLIVVLIACFFLQYGVFKRSFVEQYLTLTLAGIKRGFIWQLLSFQFLHASLLHVALNCWTLYVFGREVESILGKTRFLTLYFLAGIVGGIFHVIAALAWPAVSTAYVLGASAGIFGVVAAFAMILPDQTLSLLLIPIQFKARTLLYVSFALAVLGIPYPDKFGYGIAHLGGLLVGVAWVKLRWHDDYMQLPWERWFSGRKLSRRKKELIRATSIKIPGISRNDKESTELPQEDFISREVDPILDKISQHGIQSLTERERNILEAARWRSGKR